MLLLIQGRFIMFRYTMIMPLLFLCITAGADVSQREAIVTIPQIVDNGSFADLFNYLKIHLHLRTHTRWLC